MHKRREWRNMGTDGEKERMEEGRQGELEMTRGREWMRNE